ncbi:hypothetical protein HY625_00515 [Candidatus Uhrbacteria bacterium]|nr:hypothetical protein [Candidatus Uhrbacteria bacterium]
MHKNASSSAMPWIIGITIVVVLILGVMIAQNTPSPKTNREVALSCTTDMATQFHIHPKLTISINGQSQIIPADVGESSLCLHPLHTHDASGVIHVESPEKRDFRLSDFFAVWDKQFTKDQILDYRTDDRHSIHMTVNGQETSAYEETILRDNDAIMIAYEEKR